jgi:hypothetical protein
MTQLSGVPEGRPFCLEFHPRNHALRGGAACDNDAAIDAARQRM